MSVATTQPAPRPTANSPKAAFNRFDSPWFNPKFLIGLGMVLLIVLMAPIGPLVWDTDMAKVAQAPLNLPPAWLPDSNAVAATSSVAAEAAISTETKATTTASTDANVAEAEGQEDVKADNSITGGNPLAQSSRSSTDSSDSSITGGNPLARQNANSSGESSITGGNPLAQQNAESGGSVTGGNPLTQSSKQTSATAAADATTAPAVEAASPVSRPPSAFGSPTWDHPLGTESSGRDMLAVLLVGAPRSLWIGIIAAGIGISVGILLGFTAGFMGGWVDSLIRTIADSFITIPALAVLIVISAFVSFNNITYMALMLALFAWPGPTRLLRSQVLSMRERGYVQMARLSGASTFSIMFKEMMPNLLPYLAASFAGNVSGAILAATGLEALGLGPTRIPTLGITIFYAIRGAAILRGMWWWWGVPIAALIVIFTGLFLITVGLDEIANPRLRRKVN